MLLVIALATWTEIAGLGATVAISVLAYGLRHWLRRNRAGNGNVAYDDELHGDAAGSATLFAGVADGDPAALLARADDRRLVNAALARLPAEFREVVVLRDIEDLSYKEIAAVAAIPLGTVMSRLARGRKLLQGYLGETT